MATMIRKVLLPMDSDMYAAIDAVRGEVPRTVWIRGAIRGRLALHCPHEGCDFVSSNPDAICSKHGRRVRALDVNGR